MRAASGAPGRGNVRYPLLSALAAAACGTAAFIALRERYGGDCLFLQWNPYPDSSIDTDRVLFVAAVAIAFIICTIWFGASLGALAAAVVGGRASPIRTMVVGTTVALVVYVGMMLATWRMNPLPRDSEDHAAQRWYLSALWPIGVLQETGNFSHTFCGE